MTDLAASAAVSPGASLAPPARIASLDTVRGIAVMGILAMNIVAFAMPSQAYMNPTAYGLQSQADLGSWIFSFILIDGKMRGLFSFLFGASTLLVIQGAETAGRSPARTHYSRMFWLLVFGLVHFYFIWFGDILVMYAMVGLGLYFFRRLSVTKLIVLGAIFVVVQFLLFAYFSSNIVSLGQQIASGSASADEAGQWQALQGQFGPLVGQPLTAKLALFQGPYAGLVHDRLIEKMTAPFISLVFTVWETLAYMLFGMAALKSGFFKGEWSPARYCKVALLGFAVAIPAYAVLAWLLVRADFGLTSLVPLGLAATVPLRPVMVVAIAALIILLTRNGGWLTQRIAAAGRAAFTNYLGTSILMTTLFYGYGLGWYGHLSRVQLWLPVLGAWAIMLLWSKPWLDRYRYGPFEWLWRSLARGRFQPMRK